MAHDGEHERDEDIRGQLEVEAGRQFDLRVFNQSTWWFTPEGERIAIAALDADDCLELAGWLREYARYFYLSVLRLELFRLALRTAGVAEAVATADTSPDGVPELVYQSAEAWMESTLLYRAIART